MEVPMRGGRNAGGGGRCCCCDQLRGVSEVPEASCQSLWKLSTLASHPCTTTAGARLHTRLLWLCHAPICPCVCVGSKKLTILFHNKTTLNKGDATLPRPRKLQVFLEWWTILIPGEAGSLYYQLKEGKSLKLAIVLFDSPKMGDLMIPEKTMWP